MSLRLSAGHSGIHETHHHSDPEEEHSGCSSSEDEEEDLTWEDWVSDSAEKRPCKSLFEDKTFDAAQEAVSHDQQTHGFDLAKTTSRLGLDLYQRIRLINWIRKEHPTPEKVAALQGTEEFFKSDDYLIPTIEDDPLLQIGQDDSEDEDEANETAEKPKDLGTASRRIKALERKLQKAKQDLIDYRAFVGERLNITRLSEVLNEAENVPSSSNSAAPPRDDDSHYFQSYAENDIHAVMIQDKVRTATYAQFIQSNRELFKDAIVMDVGCGTGILSLFAARAGAKRVFAVDASDIADKAMEIVKANEFEKTITVIRGKVEDISLPDGFDHVDIIISEWMGYGLLYESMLDSVLRARDRFLRPDAGVMAPSQCRMMFALCEASELFKERVGFWGDIYGFDLSAMGTDVYDDAIVDVVGGESVVSDAVIVKDLLIREITTKQLDFSAPFRLVSTAERRTKVHAFVLYFDTIFTETGEAIPADVPVPFVREGDPMLAEVWPLGGRPHITRRMSTGDPLKAKRPRFTSFSTAPASIPTHWKQTLFLLREPITVVEGTVVEGTFKCRKSDGNSRELDVEIHFKVTEPEQESTVGDTVVQIFKVR